MKVEIIKEKIEILGLDLFETHREEMDIVAFFQEYFGHVLGWHYYLDLAWIIRHVKSLPRGALLLDAGAGSGLLQFILAELGYNVISADFADRNFPQKYIKRYGKIIHYLNSRNKVFDNRYLRHLKTSYTDHSGVKASKFAFFKKKASEINSASIIEKTRFNPADGPVCLLKGDPFHNCGRIFMYKCDLKDMSLLEDCLVDGVVSVSALEHNDHVDFERCIDEILRVTKPFGELFITVSASLSEDWFHEPSKGWCFSETTLQKLFRLSDNMMSNFNKQDVLFDELRKKDNELHKKLSDAYFKSGNNGMPWGIWDPKYQAVGIHRIK